MTKAGIQALIDNYEQNCDRNNSATYLGPTFSIDFTMRPGYSVPKFIALVESLDKVARPDEAINEIIIEEASAYFANARTAKEAAELIEKRVSIYMSEQT